MSCVALLLRKQLTSLLMQFYGCFDEDSSLSLSKYRSEICQFTRISIISLTMSSFMVENFFVVRTKIDLARNGIQFYVQSIGKLRLPLQFSSI